MRHNIEHIITLYSIITGIENRAEIMKMLQKSKTFRYLQNGDKILIYEGYMANFLEIIEELKESADCPKEIANITPSTVVMINRARNKKFAYRKNYFFPSIFRLPKLHR